LQYSTIPKSLDHTIPKPHKEIKYLDSEVHSSIENLI
jgi:hypothetical protein